MIEQESRDRTKPIHHRIFQYVPHEVGDTLFSKPLTLTPEVLEEAEMKCIEIFHHLSPSNIDFEHYQRILHTVLYRYNIILAELQRLHELLNRILNGATLRLRKIKLLYDPQFQPVERLANKLKLLYSKGRKKIDSTNVYDRIDNCLERCEKFHGSYYQHTFNKTTLLQKELFDQLLSIKKRFDVINPKSVFLFTQHPIQSLPPKTKFVINFYNELLLIHERTPITFNPSLLFCPILFENEEYKINPEYYEELEEYLRDWSSKVLTVEILVDYKVKFSSYLRIDYAETSMMQKLTLIRDKIYQFMIFEYLRHLVSSHKNMVLIATSHPSVKVKIHLKTLSKNDPKFTSEFISIILAILKDSRLYELRRNEIIDKIKFTVEEVLISKTSTVGVMSVVSENKQEFTKYYQKRGQTSYVLINPVEALGKLVD